MRFVADGPTIPDTLLEERDLGNVVFFCGAGVSVPAGLPNFTDLTIRVMKALGTPDDAPSRRLFKTLDDAHIDDPSLDQVFNQLNEEYSRDEVERTVNQILATPKKALGDTHSVILRLSRHSSRRPRLVTTNFDLLFERADRKVPIHVAPTLPDIAASDGFEGVVYLHGRRAPQPRSRANRLVLSSSDLGRAYLADGWATRFVKDLLQTYLIVLVGYKASDPPVRYLLEGLRSRSTDRRIYAFDDGSFGRVVARWRTRGVTALPYSQHAVLWNTLRAWADRADDPDRWRSSVVDLARQGPRVLAPFQRGQVASLVRSPEGAAAFANAEPLLPAEWLCVFDKYVRYGPNPASGGEAPQDPLAEYGLDDDTPRTDQTTNMGSSAPESSIGNDLIAISPIDGRSDGHLRLAGVSVRHGDMLPTRLSKLADWFGSVADEPAAMWWAGDYKSLHPQLLRRVEWHFKKRADFTNFGRRAWSLLLERYRYSPESRHDDGWYSFTLRLEQEGWTRQTIRDFGRAVQPYLSSRRPSRASFPPATDTVIERLDDVIDFDVEYPGYNRDKVNVSSEVLPIVFEIARKGLERAADLLTEIDKRYWRTVSFIPDDEPGTRYLNKASKYFHWVRDLFDRLAAENSDVARDEVRRWRYNDKYFFNKFRIYAWMNSTVVPGRDVAEGLLSLPDDVFWELSHRRELLHTLRARWSEFGNGPARKIESRIVKGRKPWRDEKKHDYRTRVRTTAATILEWLDRNKCQLSRQTLRRVQRLKAHIPNWRDSQADSPDRGLDSRSGFTETDTDPTVLLDTPLSQVAALAEQYSHEDPFATVHHQPFQGLVQTRPRRALIALRLEMRHGRLHRRLWSSLLNGWPPGTSERLLAVCGGRLVSLADKDLIALRSEVARWCREHSPRLVPKYSSLAYRLFDRFLNLLLAAGDESTTSALGDVSIAGQTVASSRRTIEHAINSPIGDLTNGLLQIVNGSEPKKGSGIPVQIKCRFERLLGSPGEGADHSAIMLAQNLSLLYHIDSDWTSERLVPLFNPDHHFGEPVWNGLLNARCIPAPKLFVLLKPYLMRVFDSAQDWTWDHDTATSKLVEFLVSASSKKRHNASYVSYQEVRAALRKVDDAARSHAVWLLAQIATSKQDWESFGRHFIEKAWPRESRCQTPEASRQFAFLAEQSGDQFPSVVKAIRPFLVHADDLDLTVYGLSEDNGKASLASRFPADALELLDRLISDAPKAVPYELGEVIASIADAAPDLRDDQRWRRLRRLGEKR